MDATLSVTYHITKTGNLLRQLVAKRLKDAQINLTPEESALMNQLWDSDEQTVSELGKWSIKDPSTLTRQIDGLVNKGFVTRYNGTEDRRKVFVKLTASGKKLKTQFNNTGIPRFDMELANLNEKQTQAIIKMLLEIQEKALSELKNNGR